MRKPFLWLTLGLMPCLSACYFPTTFEKTDGIEHTLNPQPKQGYEITMTLADVPGPFTSMLGLVHYEMVNSECLPPPKNKRGYNRYMMHDVPFELTRVSETEYTGMVYADGILDEDYYGHGICRWQLIRAQVHLKATSTPGETVFDATISAERLLAEKTEKNYYSKKFYTRHPGSKSDTLTFGHPDVTMLPPQSMEKDFFTVTLASKRISP